MIKFIVELDDDFDQGEDELRNMLHEAIRDSGLIGKVSSLQPEFLLG